MLQRVAPALDSKSLRPEDVLQFKAPIAGYLCPVEANTFGVEFLSFEIRDYDSGRTVYSVSEGLHSIGSRLRPRLPRSPDFGACASLPVPSWRRTMRDGCTCHHVPVYQ